MLSETARAAAARLHACTKDGRPIVSASASDGLAPTPTDLLHVQVADLQKMVARLRALIDDDLPDAEFTDIQASEFLDRFTTSLADTHPAVLARAYGVEYFKSAPRNVRLLMATALINHASKTEGFQSPSVWGTLLANSGYLQQ